MAYADDQLGYWNFVYQAGGYILNEDKTKAGFTQPATEKAMKFYIGLQQNDWCPDQTYFAETAPGTAFFSEKGAMFLEGDWNILAELQNYPEMVGKWDVAVLPKCPDPESGDGRATISNGLCYATAASNKNLDTVKDILKFFGSEEGQRIQAKVVRPSLPIRVWRIPGQAALQSIPSISSASLRCLSTAFRASTTPLARSGRARSMMSC